MSKVGAILGKIFSGGADKIVGTIFDGIDDLTLSKEEKLRIEENAKRAVFRYELDLKAATKAAFEAEVADRNSARDLYRSDSLLQKIFALTFLLAYVGLTLFLLYCFFFPGAKVELQQWEIGFVSTLFGAMSTKVSTITDFLFGGSMAPKDPEKLNLNNGSK